jgi:CO dehydrogenase/acetyl-CoA synthase alpha subunit
MCSNGTAPDPPRPLSQDVVELLDDLDEGELRAVVDYARKRLAEVHPTVTEQIEARADEEIVRVKERDAYTEVVKRQYCGEDCGECPHPYLYHVTEERHTDGSTRLHWSYLGHVVE